MDGKDLLTMLRIAVVGVFLISLFSSPVTWGAAPSSCRRIAVLSTQYSVLGTQYSLLGIHRLRLTTHHSLFFLTFQSGEPNDPDQTYLDALRERKMYRLLEVYCNKQLRRSDATPAERARFTIELANILAAHAQEQTQANARAELWQKASTLLRSFLDQNPQHPQAGALQFQLGVYELAQGELCRLQAKLAPQDMELTESAKSRLQAAVQSFRQVEAEVTQAMKKRTPSDIAVGGQVTYKQLLALSSNTRFRLGQAELALAQLLPRHSAAQTDHASQAKLQFEAFTQRYSTNELTLESYLGRAECLRLLSDPAEAMKSLRELEKPGTPDKYLDRSLVLRAQLQLDQKKPAAARNFIEDARKLLKNPNPELDLLYVQATLELARELSKLQDHLGARQRVAEALKTMDEIEQTHGAYWATRSLLLLAELAADNLLVEDASVLARMANGQYRLGDQSGTLATLDRAVKLARERGDVGQTVELSFRAASILFQAGKVEDAAVRFAEIAGTYPNHPKAPQAQFMVAISFGKAYGENPKPERLAQYEQALEQHLRAFGNDETASEVRWLLGSLRLSKRLWSDAIDFYQGIQSTEKRFPAARLEMARAYESWAQYLWSKSQPGEKVVGEAIRYLKQALSAPRGTPLTADDVPLALSLARLLSHSTLGRYAEAEEVLEQILFGQAANETERAEARRLNVAVLLGQDKFTAASRLLDAEFVGVPKELFAVVQSLEDAAGRSSETRRRQIGKLQLGATERLVKEADQLTPDQSLQTEIYLALAYVNAGEANHAEEIFTKLRDRVPNSPRVLEAQAECFMQLGRYSQARELWRQLVGIVRENSPAWFRAKYKLALCCFLTNDLQQCLKIIQVTTLLHPELGGPELKAKFEELLARCQAR